MQVQKILKTQERSKAYYLFIQPYEIYAVRWLSIVGAIYTFVFLFIDFSRAKHVSFVLTLRGSLIVFLAFIAWYTLRQKISVRGLHLVCGLMSMVLFSVGFILDFYGGMPVFFITNYICLHLYVFNAAMGHILRFKIMLTAFLCIVFALYAQYLSPYSAIHVAQSFNIWMNASLSIVIGVLSERYKLQTFAQRAKLITSRRKNKELNDLKSKLISIISHDLASPLNTLKGLLHLKESNLISAEELEANSKNVKQALENVMSMQKNLLTWSQLQLGGFHASAKSIEVDKVVNEIIDAVKQSALQKKIIIQNNVPVGSQLKIDEEVLRMVVRNFIVNAIKYSHANGRIVVSSTKDEHLFKLSVLDSGTGMSTQQLKNLFSFRKSPTPGTQNEMGSGIGLVITKDFVEMIGGTLHVQSEPGKGSLFSVSFPVNS